MKIAFIGFGNSVRNYHLPYLTNVDEISVKKIYRREEDRCNDLASEQWFPDITFTSCLNDVLDDSEIELIVVNTHVDTHAFYAMEALKHGKHVLVEKPFANDSAEAKMIFDFAAEKGLIAMSNQNRRFDGDFLTLKKVLASGRLGKVVELQSHYHYFSPDKVKPEFGKLYGLAVHTLDQVWSLYGRPERVVYDVRSIYFPGESDDYIDIDFFYGDTKVTIKCSDYVKSKSPKFIVYGDKGSFIKYSSGHQAKNPEGPTMVDFTPEPEDNWGILEYRDSEGHDRREHIMSSITEYGILYRELYHAIRHGAIKPVQDDEVLGVLGILEKGIIEAKLQTRRS